MVENNHLSHRSGTESQINPCIPAFHVFRAFRAFVHSCIRAFVPSCICALLFLTGCGVTKQAQEAANVARCDFRIISAEKIMMGGVSFQNVRSVRDLNMGDLAMLMAGYASPTFPLSMTLLLQGRNPNPKPAGMNRLEWILFIDDIQMTSGILNKPFLIPPNNGTVNIPVEIALDLKQAMNGKSSEAILNFGLNLAGMGNKPSRFKIKIKPIITVGNTQIDFPGYITVKTEYSGN
jgi:hypothetical protein